MIRENIRSAFLSLSGNKMRTLLSVIGIVIGVASVIAITALGESAGQSIKKQIAKSGLETITVSLGRDAGAEMKRIFTEELIPSIQEVDGILSVIPFNQKNFQLRTTEANAQDSVATALPEYVKLFSLNLTEGRFIQAEDIEAKSMVVVLGSELATSLFPSGDAIGKYVSILGDKRNRLRVIGILETKNDISGMSFDSIAFIPRTSYLTRVVKTSRVDRFVIQADIKKDVAATAKSLETKLTKMAGSSTAFRVMSPSTIAETFSGVTSTLSAFLAGIAAISLIVGGIGIMNIMLVSVTERTKEIGIRKAIGASAQVILMQFLIEAATLTLLGGFFGIVFGSLISYVVCKSFSWDFIISWQAVLIALFVSAGTGLFFGLYPASRASKMEPVSALNYE